jgi:hypothetical protein
VDESSLVIRQEPQRFQLVVAEEVGLLDDQDGGASALGLFGGERVGGLRSQGRVVGQGLPAQGGDDAVVDSAHPDGGIGQVDDVVAATVQGGHGSADGDGLASADLAGDDADAAFGDAPADAGDRFVVRGVAVQHAGGQIAAERHPRKPEESGQTLDHRGCTSSPLSRSSCPGIWSAPDRAA